MIRGEELLKRNRWKRILRDDEYKMLEDGEGLIFTVRWITTGHSMKAPFIFI